jgi:hypothetical protein
VLTVSTLLVFRENPVQHRTRWVKHSLAFFCSSRSCARVDDDDEEEEDERREEEEREDGEEEERDERNH